MPTPAEIVDGIAALQNDLSKSEYNYLACYPYLNMALEVLEQEFQLNNIPVTDETSSAIIIPAGTPVINYNTIPALPANLVEIRELWESPTLLNQWTKMKRVDILPQYLFDGTQISQFLVWSNKDNAINVVPANAIIDLKIDYIKTLFPTLTVDDENSELGTKFDKARLYLKFKTAAFCSYFIGENEDRAGVLNSEANEFLQKTMGISVKGKQSMPVRRLPFRASFKRRGLTI